MKILLFGKQGQLGWELNRSLLPVGDVVPLDRQQADISSMDAIRNVIREVKPSVIVNAAAYTAVDRAESDMQQCMTMNAEAPGVMAEESRKIGALLVHYSTDYVFDGKKSTTYTESDEFNPLNVYGKSKLEGERAIRESGCEHLLLRTSWVFSTRGRNFLLSILRLAREKQQLNIVNDQIGSPTWARNIADMSAHIILQSNKERQSGNFSSDTYNICSSGETTWFDFAKSILELAYVAGRSYDYSANKLDPVTSEQYQSAAVRPLYSVLSTEKAESTFGIRSVHWKDALACCMASLRG